MTQLNIFDIYGRNIQYHCTSLNYKNNMFKLNIYKKQVNEKSQILFIHLLYFHTLTTIFLHRIPESFSDDLTTVRDHHKCMRFHASYEFPELQRLVTIHNCHDSFLWLVWIRAFCRHNGRTVIQLFMNIIADCISIIWHDCKIFTQVQTLNYGINEKWFCKESGKWKQSNGRIIYKERNQNNCEIYKQ